MSIEALKIISDCLESLGINYEFMEWSSTPIPETYFVGEYQETEPMNEDGMQQTTFILTGHSRNSQIALEEAKKEIEYLFPKVEGKTVITDSGSAVAIFYANSSPIPSVVGGLRKIQINLLVKEWKGE